jgi:DNA invertase Pin-like site-specific DNA recombinase/DNA-binding TFAR19-related protein (PDSD5 family)
VSRVGERGGETFVSPDEQRARIRAYCKREGLRLIGDPVPEMDVSGGAPLARRPGLRQAVELVEAGGAEVIVGAYFDRLVRSVCVQLEVIERVEQAGGEVVALDVGKLTNGSASQRLSSTMLGAVAEYARGMTAERTQEAKERAVARGVPPFPNVPPGYRRGEGQRLEVDPETADAVREAFRLRAEGATIASVRDYLRTAGIRRSYHGVLAMLGSRVYLGELHFGAIANLDSHAALVDAATFKRANGQRIARGRRPKSERLLARLGILRCATCGARMVVGSTRQQGKPYAFYRCDPLHDCPKRVTISADKAEEAVEAETRRLLAEMKGRASAAKGAEAAARKLERAQAELDSAARVLIGAGLEGEASATERLAQLRQARDDAAERVEELASLSDVSSAVVDPERDWPLLTLEERRALIRAVVARAVVSPGRGDDRIVVEPRGQ